MRSETNLPSRTQENLGSELGPPPRNSERKWFGLSLAPEQQSQQEAVLYLRPFHVKHKDGIVPMISQMFP